MSDFILDQQINNVKSKKVKKYLHEVISTYYNGNYRSCIVTLYSVVIFDFIEKLQILKDIYENDSAIKFFEKFEVKQQNSNTKYSELENEIIEEIKNQKILTPIEITQLEQLKSTRDYCAHPVFKNDYELINPTKEQTIAHIRNAFEAVFLKDAILNKKIYKNYLFDLEEFFERNETEGLEKYLNAKYFSKMNEASKKFLFHNLWKLAFYMKDDDKCEKYRKAVCCSLIYLTNTDKRLLEEYFNENKEKFNNWILCEEVEIKMDDKYINFFKYPIFALIYFLAEEPQLYRYINEDKRVEIENVCKKNINIYLLAYFINSNVNKHIDKVKEMISEYNYCIDSNIFLKLYDKTKSIDSAPVKKLAIHYFLNNVYSPMYGKDYDYINWIYRDILSKVLCDFNREDISELLNGMTTFYEKANCYDQLKNQIIQLVEDGVSIELKDIDISKNWM